jgi:cobalt-zinc-cadmium efflux system protein
MAAEVVVAAISGSLALLADAGHMLTDALAVVGAIAVARLARRPPGGAWTFGLRRAENLSAAANGVAMVVIAALVSYEAIRRLIHPPPVEGVPLVVLAVVGVAMNLAVVWLLARADRTSMNIEGTFQHILTDLYAFAGTAVAGAVILATGIVRADSVASLLVAALIVRAAWSVLHSSGHVLLEAAPANVDLAELRRHLLECSQVADVHDLHVWAVTPDLPAVSAHVVLSDASFLNGSAPQVLDRLQRCLAGHFDVEHSTFQLEPAGHGDHEVGAHP